MRQKLKQAIENSQSLDMTRVGCFTVESWIKPDKLTTLQIQMFYNDLSHQAGGAHKR